jgi:phosphoribulokinase
MSTTSTKTKRAHSKKPVAASSNGGDAPQQRNTQQERRLMSWVNRNSGRIIAAFTSEANQAGTLHNYELMNEYLGVIQEFRQVCGLPQQSAQIAQQPKALAAAAGA